MSYALTYSRAYVGVEAPLVSVETHLSAGLPALTIVGLPETAVRESKDRVRSAIINAGFEFPAKRITINLAPADLPKEGGRCDNGPEFISHELIDWAIKEQITLLYIQPGKPNQKAYIERFNRTARHELLELNLFEDIEHAQLLATQWQWTYNNIRPHSAIGGVPPRQLL